MMTIIVKIETPWLKRGEKGPSLKRKRKTAGKLLAAPRFKSKK